jgi:hypothetical protein
MDLLEMMKSAALSAAPFGIGGGVENFLEQRRAKKLEEARDALLVAIEEARDLPNKASSKDDILDVIYRYLRAAESGAARRNIKLMARFLVFESVAGRSKRSFIGEQIEVLSSVSEDEIALLVLLYKRRIETGDPEFGIDKLMEAGIPALFGTREEVHAVANRASRTGYLKTNERATLGGGETDFQLSQRFFKLIDVLGGVDALEKLNVD